jgi:hypothetical protein
MSRNDPLAPEPIPQPQSLLSGAFQQIKTNPSNNAGIPIQSSIVAPDLLQRAQQTAQSIEPLHRLIDAVDWLNQNIFGGPQGQVGSAAPAAVGIAARTNTAEKVLDLLKNTQPEALNRFPGFNFTGDQLGEVIPKIQKQFAPEELAEVKQYLEAIRSWKEGNMHNVRYALESPVGAKVTSKQIPENKSWGNVADRLMNLVTKSDYQTSAPLYRQTEGLEFPGRTPQRGQVFHLGPTSWSATPQWPRHWRTPYTVVMEPGARTVPIGGVMGFPNEFEHLASGQMKVDSVNGRLVRLRQVDPTIPKSR